MELQEIMNAEGPCFYRTYEELKLIWSAEQLGEAQEFLSYL